MFGLVPHRLLGDVLALGVLNQALNQRTVTANYRSGGILVSRTVGFKDGRGGVSLRW